MSKQIETEITEQILDAIADQKLPAGTKLVEQELAAIYGCDRAKIRRAFVMLTGYGVVDLVKNRGAFVKIPSETEAREVFQARRGIEAVITRNAVRHATPEDIAQLRAHLAEEATAYAHGPQRRSDILRLSREFHVILSRIGRNSVLARYLEELTLRTSLILGCYGSPDEKLCATSDHQQIVDAIQLRDEPRACALIEHHLRHLEAGVRYDGGLPMAGPLARILGATTTC